VKLKKGATVTVDGGSATVDTLRAKAVKIDPGAIGGAVGFSKTNPVPYYIKYEAVNQPPKPPTGGGGGGGGGFDWGGTASGLAISLAEMVAMTLIMKKFTGGGGPKGPTGKATEEVDRLIADAFGGAAKGSPALAKDAKGAREVMKGLLNSPDAKPPTTDITWVDPSLFKARLQDAFNFGFKGLALAAPLGLAITAAFKAPALVRTAASGLVGMVDGAFASVAAILINFNPAKGLKGVNAPKGGPAIGAAFLGPGVAKMILDMGTAVVGALGAGIKAKVGDLVNIGKWIVEAITSAAIKGVHIAGVTTGTGAPKQDPTIDVSKGTRHDAKTGRTEVYRGGKWQEQDALGHWITPPPASLKPGGGYAIIAPLGQTAAAHPALHAEMQRQMARVAAPSGTSAHRATAQTVHHTTTITNHVTVNEARTPQATGDAVLKALSAAAQRKQKHGR